MKANGYAVYCFIITLTLVFTFTTKLSAQVTIGSGEAPQKDALLDLKENSLGTSTKGLLLPRVALSSTISPNPLSAHVVGMSVYNTATAGDVVPGYYYNDGHKWVRLQPDESQSMPKFFYMPSIVLPIDTSDPSYNSTTKDFTINLYTLYSEQFGLSNSASSQKSPAATSLPVIGSSALEYFITYYDNTVFKDVKVSNSGVLNYKLNSVITLSEKTFMNIILKVK